MLHFYGTSSPSRPHRPVFMKPSLRLVHRIALTALSAIGVSACNPHLLPQDTVGLDTLQIVTHVRCEARDGVRTYIKGRLRQFSGVPLYDGFTGAQLVERLNDGRTQWSNLKIDRFSEPLRSNFSYYGASQISYDFTFDLNEDNLQSAQLSLTRSFISKRVDTLGFTFKNSTMRQNRRNFRVYDTFADLALNLSDDRCLDRTKQVKYEYPLTGTLRVDDLVGTFLGLNEVGNLIGGKESPSVPSVADTINFTTKLTGNIDPSFVLVPLGHSFGLASITVGNDSTRSDQHQVIIAMSLAPKETGTYKFDKAGNVVRFSPAETQREYANVVLDAQRNKALQDAVTQFGVAFNRGPP